MTPPFFDPHVCSPPPTYSRTEYAEWECKCGRRWYMSWFRYKGQMLGPSWILEARGA
jgi:hypothetical protein